MRLHNFLPSISTNSKFVVEIFVAIHISIISLYLNSFTSLSNFITSATVNDGYILLSSRNETASSSLFDVKLFALILEASIGQNSALFAENVVSSIFIASPICLSVAMLSAYVEMKYPSLHTLSDGNHVFEAWPDGSWLLSWMILGRFEESVIIV